MSKAITAFCLSFFSALTFAIDFEPESSCDEKIEHKFYTVCYSQSHRQAIWTYHKLTLKSINGSSKRKNNYRADLKIVDPVTKSDYKKTGFDRGHLVPAADMKLTDMAMSQTFYMSNMSPQRPELNRYIWANLENGIRSMVTTMGDAFVVTAPVLDNTLSQLPAKISIPKFYYKIAYFPKKKIMRAYLLENKSHKGRKFSEYQVSVDSIEKLTGIDFFSELHDKLENQLERVIK